MGRSVAPLALLAIGCPIATLQSGDPTAPCVVREWSGLAVDGHQVPAVPFLRDPRKSPVVYYLGFEEDSLHDHAFRFHAVIFLEGLQDLVVVYRRVFAGIVRICHVGYFQLFRWWPWRDSNPHLPSLRGASIPGGKAISCVLLPRYAKGARPFGPAPRAVGWVSRSRWPRRPRPPFWPSAARGTFPCAACACRPRRCSPARGPRCGPSARARIPRPSSGS